MDGRKQGCDAGHRLCLLSQQTKYARTLRQDVARKFLRITTRLPSGGETALSSVRERSLREIDPEFAELRQAFAVSTCAA
jgi:hypothetical protein